MEHTITSDRDRLRRLLMLCLAVVPLWLACELAALYVRQAMPDENSISPLSLAYVNILNGPHYPIALAGIFFLFALSAVPVEPDGTVKAAGLGELAAGAALAVLLTPGLVLLRHWLMVTFHADALDDNESTVTTYSVSLDACIALGLAGLVMLARRAWLSNGQARERTLLYLLNSVLIVVFVPIIFFFLALTILACPKPVDPLIYAAESTLGFQPSFVLGEWMFIPDARSAIEMEVGPGRRAVQIVPFVVYCALPLQFLIILALQLGGEYRPRLDILMPFFWVAVTGALVYPLVPVIGPRYAFDKYPLVAPPVETVLADYARLEHVPQVSLSHPQPEEGRSYGSFRITKTPRNAMPSLHTAWALLMWWQARPLGRWLRSVAGLFLVGTLLATVGFGPHYLLDLIVAFPSTLVAQALGLPPCPPIFRRRVRAAVIGLVLSGGWLVLLASGTVYQFFTPLVTWPLAVATVLAALWEEETLYRAFAAESDAGPEKDAELLAAPGS